MSTTKENLIAARDLIVNPTTWTQGTYARNEYGISSCPRDSSSCCWCAVGALMKTMKIWNDRWDETDEWHALNKSSRELFTIDPINVNDGYKHADVIRMFDRAIELAGQP